MPKMFPPMSDAMAMPKAFAKEAQPAMAPLAVLPPCMRFQTDMWDIVIQLYIRFQ